MPLCNHTGWLEVKHQITYFLTPLSKEFALILSTADALERKTRTCLFCKKHHFVLPSTPNRWMASFIQKNMYPSLTIYTFSHSFCPHVDWPKFTVTDSSATCWSFWCFKMRSLEHRFKSMWRSWWVMSWTLPSTPVSLTRSRSASTNSSTPLGRWDVSWIFVCVHFGLLWRTVLSKDC